MMTEAPFGPSEMLLVLGNLSQGSVWHPVEVHN